MRQELKIMMHNYLLCYDIFNGKRLYKIRKISYPFALGGQKSALEMPLSRKEAKVLLTTLSPHSAPEDKINLIEIEEHPLYIGKSIDVIFEEGMIIL
jgi:CRISPR/Cas system-associated endoribonuclease Cas2